MKKILSILLFFILIFTTSSYANYSITFAENTNLVTDVDGAEGTHSFWDLPLDFKLIAISAVIMALGWKIVAILTAWIEKNPKNKNRLNILRFIEHNPGSTVFDIVNDLDLNRGTVRYHVRNLKEDGKILLFRNRNTVGLFRNKSGLWNKSYLQEIEQYLQDSTCKKVCRLIYENPGITNMQIADRLGITKGTVTSHIRTLEEMGCLTVEYTGKFKNYYLREGNHPDALQFFEKIR